MTMQALKDTTALYRVSLLVRLWGSLPLRGAVGVDLSSRSGPVRSYLSEGRDDGAAVAIKPTDVGLVRPI